MSQRGKRQLLVHRKPRRGGLSLALPSKPSLARVINRVISCSTIWNTVGQTHLSPHQDLGLQKTLPFHSNSFEKSAPASTGHPLDREGFVLDHSVPVLHLYLGCSLFSPSGTHLKTELPYLAVDLQAFGSSPWEKAAPLWRTWAATFLHLSLSSYQGAWVTCFTKVIWRSRMYRWIKVAAIC